MGMNVTQSTGVALRELVGVCVLSVLPTSPFNRAQLPHSPRLWWTKLCISKHSVTLCSKCALIFQYTWSTFAYSKQELTASRIFRLFSLIVTFHSTYRISYSKHKSHLSFKIFPKQTNKTDNLE